MTPSNDDLLRQLPLHEPPPAIEAKARAAFMRGREPWFRSAVVPVGLASVVGLYLFWAFTTVIALNH